MPRSQDATTDSTTLTSPSIPGRVSVLDRYFEITKRGSTLGREVRGGLTTFFTMAYIIVLNPIILTKTADVMGNKLSFAAIAATTALVAGVMTILMGVTPAKQHLGM